MFKLCLSTSWTSQTTLKKGIIVLISLLTCLVTYGQTLTKRLILTDTKDSSFFYSSEIAFDRLGNYCFLSKNGELEYFVKNDDTIGGFKFIGSISGNGGGISHTNSGSDSQEKPFYYKNASGTKVYGTAIGKIEDYQTSNTKENIAIVTTLKNTAYYYINGKQVSQNVKDPKKDYGLEKDWVAFSENGNVIYYLKKGDFYCLFVNDKLIDSSEFSYTQLAINNRGIYIYAKGKEPKKPIGKYNYMFFVHSIDTVLGYVRTVWDYELKENGAYYYSGDDNGPYYIAINDKLYKNINSISNLKLVDKNTYLYSFEEDNKNKINVNGKIYTHDFDKIFNPTLDKQGNFALYGMKGYYLYKFINGKKEEKPISKYGVRPTPLYISTKGEAIHYFKTDDSIYLYQDEKLIFDPLPKNSGFLIEPYTDFLPYSFVRGKTENENSLFYLQYNQQGYFVFNGKFSRPMLPVKQRGYAKDQEQGAIVEGEFNSNGFFTIQKTDKRKYLITVNNEIYQELEEIDYIIRDNYFFDEKELIFYGVKDMSIYQFKLSL